MLKSGSNTGNIFFQPVSQHRCRGIVANLRNSICIIGQSCVNMAPSYIFVLFCFFVFGDYKVLYWFPALLAITTTITYRRVAEVFQRVFVCD